MSKNNENSTNYPSPLFNHHIQYILKSGVLLDEDMECILTYYNSSDEISEQKGFTLYEKIVGTFSFASSIFLFHKKFPTLFTTLSASPCAILILKRLRDVLRDKKQKHNLETFVDSVHLMAKLNRQIFEYFRIRRIYDSSTVSVINPYTKRMKQLLQVIFDEETNLLYSFRIIIRQFGTYVPFLITDYAYLENIELHDFSTANVDNIDDCVNYLQKLCDVYVLVSSNCLTCLALTLCPSIQAKNDINYNEIRYKIVPKLKSIVSNCYNAINKQFDDVKYYYLNRIQAKKSIKKPKPSASMKLQVSAYNTMVHTTEILEKSRIIYKKLQEVDLQSLSEKEKLGKCIKDLRSHVFDYYESLDVLYKIFQVNINACQGKSPSSHLEIPNETNDDNDFRTVQDASLNPVEPSDDEEYELYIGANEGSSDSTNYSYYEEQEGRKLATLLGQELKHKLKTHSQFVAARKKRGIIDEEPESPEAKTVEVVPNFELPPLPPPLPVMMVQEENHQEEPQRLLVPPPPPPPLPPIDLGLFGGNVAAPYTVDDYFEAIKAVSKSRSNIEEVFGDDSEDED